MTGELNGAHRSIRAHLIVGLSLMLVLAGGFGGWASTVQISGALIAPGSVVVDSNVKKVQHPTGGIVGELGLDVSGQAEFEVGEDVQLGYNELRKRVEAGGITRGNCIEPATASLASRRRPIFPAGFNEQFGIGRIRLRGKGSRSNAGAVGLRYSNDSAHVKGPDSRPREKAHASSMLACAPSNNTVFPSSSAAWRNEVVSEIWGFSLLP